MIYCPVPLIVLLTSNPMGVGDLQLTYGSNVLDMYFDGRMRASDPTVITVYHFVEAVYEEQPPSHKIGKAAFPKAQLLINMVDDFLISGDIFREELPSDGAKLQFMRGLCRWISWKYESPSNNLDPKEFRAMAFRSFKKGFRAKDNAHEGELDFRKLCQLGLIWTDDDMSTVKSTGSSLAQACTRSDRWLGLRARLAVVERLRSAGNLAEARKLADKALKDSIEFKEWDSYKRLLRVSAENSSVRIQPRKSIQASYNTV